MNNPGIDLTFDLNNLYAEESFTDLKVGAIRRLKPVNPDGSDDTSREPLYFGQTQLMSPNGPLPVNCTIEATSLTDAIEKFPEAINGEVERIIEMAQKDQEKESSRIIVPGP